MSQDANGLSVQISPFSVFAEDYTCERDLAVNSPTIGHLTIFPNALRQVLYNIQVKSDMESRGYVLNGTRRATEEEIAAMSKANELALSSVIWVVDHVKQGAVEEFLVNMAMDVFVEAAGIGNLRFGVSESRRGGLKPGAILGRLSMPAARGLIRQASETGDNPTLHELRNLVAEEIPLRRGRPKKHIDRRYEKTIPVFKKTLREAVRRVRRRYRRMDSWPVQEYRRYLRLDVLDSCMPCVGWDSGKKDRVLKEISDPKRGPTEVADMILARHFGPDGLTKRTMRKVTTRKTRP